MIKSVDTKCDNILTIKWLQRFSVALIYSEQIFKKILILVKIKIKLLNQFAF